MQSTELTLVREEQAKRNPHRELVELLASQPLTDEQNATFEAVQECFANQKSGIFYVQGGGGTGKTHLMKVCDAWVRCQIDPTSQLPAIALICATTALAAHNFKDASTAHALFKIPAEDVDDDEDTDALVSKLRQHPGALELVQAARFIGWDEFPSAHRRVFEAAYRATNRFAGAILLCSGDLRQLTPVVKSNSVEQQLISSVVYSPYWSKFRIFKLGINFRQRHDPKYAQWAVSIGEGRIGEYTAEQSYRSEVELSNMIHTQFHEENIEQAISWVYPHLNATAYESSARAIIMARSAIIANTNDRVDFWNKAVQGRLQAHISHTYLSQDTLCDIQTDKHIR